MMRAWLITALLCTTCLAWLAPRSDPTLSVIISVAQGILKRPTDGHIQLMFAPAGVAPLDNTDVTTSPNLFFGRNVHQLQSGSSVVLAGGNGINTDFGVWGYPNTSIDDIAPGDYNVQAFLNPYETATRADGSQVSLRFPCGDGGLSVGGYGTPITSILNVTVTGQAQAIELTFNDITPGKDFNGTEIGGCYQGNYADTPNLKYIKIRSTVLSKWWNRDIYVGANVLLPYGYNAGETSIRYPVVYSQGHWAGGASPFSSLASDFSSIWANGTIPATRSAPSRPTPKFIAVQFRQEGPFYDDAYAVNSANLGPWGDAINDELIPYLDSKFNTIPHAYGRIQEGGSTGGWASAASLIYRPDLFGACFSSYPDSMDFHRHQEIPLYDSRSAYRRPDGSPYVSIREFQDGKQISLTTVAMENHWELSFGTSSRSFSQWDVWNAVFGVQGYNAYPLEPWDKVTGEIYPAAVQLWKPFDLSDWVTSHWDAPLNLGAVLRSRIFVYVGTADTYFLNEGVAAFQAAVEAKGGVGWANFTYIEGAAHGGTYQRLDLWDYLYLLDGWFKDHAPGGKTPLTAAATSQSARGNLWVDVQKHGGRQAAVARQAVPVVTGREASVGRWDPGVKLTAQWFVNGKADGAPFGVVQNSVVKYTGNNSTKLQVAVTGKKRGYRDETRTSS